MRYIDPIPRQISVSKKFPKKLPAVVEKGLHVIEKLIREGKDVNPYQSKGLIRFNDISGGRRAKRTDLLWADWGINHLHITDMPIADGEYFSERKCSNGESWLLFCLFVGNTVGFIDIRRHEEYVFSDQDMIKTVKESWPGYMEKFRLNGISPSREGFTNAEIAHLRANGICSPLCIDDDVYMGPGMGISTASTSVRVTTQADRVLDWLDFLAVLADDENGQLQAEVKRLGIEKPEFELCLTPQGLAIFEPKANIAFTFSMKADDESSAYSAQMVNLICPEWALKVLTKGTGVDFFLTSSH
ncbi:MAG: hypothetical protein WAW87_11030 [Candidatus Ferrigenium altingense]